MRPILSVVSDRYPGAGPSAVTLGVLADRSDSDLREIVSLVRNLCGTRQAAISIMDGESYHLVITAGIEPLVAPAGEALCAHTMDADYPVYIEDASTDDRVSGSPYVDGTKLAIRFYGSAPIYAPDRTMVGRLCVFDSEPKRISPMQEQALMALANTVSGVLELRMRQQEDAAVREEQNAASEEVLKVAAQISHDMRVPLTALTTSLDMLHESEPADIDPIRARVFASARRSAQRLTGMVEGLLRLNDVQHSHRSTDCDLSVLVHQLVADAHAMLADADADLHIGHLPLVRADRDQMYSLFLNLLSNSVKFAREGVPPVIRLDSKPETDCWRISVTDNGQGIPQEKADEVFSMFSRLNPAVAGHGIGLATVARIVQAHGGRVGAIPATGHGTEIWFTLPHRWADDPTR